MLVREASGEILKLTGQSGVMKALNVQFWSVQDDCPGATEIKKKNTDQIRCDTGDNWKLPDKNSAGQYQ